MEKDRKIRPSTLSDVAARAGVNKATASVVLNRARSGTVVSEATRERILEAARELRYHPNAIARSLNRQQTDILGLFLGRPIRFTDPFFVEIHTGLQAGCAAAQKNLLIYDTLHKRPVESIYAELVSRKIDGLLLYTPEDDPLVERLRESHLPVVALADPVSGLPSVTIDNVRGGALLAAHLWESGHRHVLYCDRPNPATSVERRFAGFREVADRHGMQITRIHSHPENPVSEEERALLAVPANQRGFTAVVCWNDFYAYSLLSHCQMVGVRVPDELAVAGFDGVRVRFARTTWDLTTVQAPWQDVAATAVSLLMDLTAGKEVPEETVLPVTLIRGATTRSRG